MRFYWVSTESHTKDDGRRFCKNGRGSLLKITSDFEFKVAKALALEVSLRFNNPCEFEEIIFFNLDFFILKTIE